MNNSETPKLRIAFAGDRDVSVSVLRRILADDVRPLALMVSEPARASHANELISLCPFLPPEGILIGADFRQPTGIAYLKNLDLDWVIAIHFPYIVPPQVLSIPKQGVLNLHPAYLPFNRGWHTPSWAILEGTPIGATLHFMDEGVDTGDIVHQKQIVVSPADTAHSLYRRLKDLEVEVFEEAWPKLLLGVYQRVAQNPHDGATHKQAELLQSCIQQIDLNTTMRVKDILTTLRALTTNKIAEAAYFEEDGKQYRIQVIIHEE